MAKKKPDEDLDLGIEQGGGSKKKLILFIALGVLLLGGGGGAAWFLLSGSGEETVEAKSAEGQQAMPAIYHSMTPVFVANLSEGSQAKLLQVSVEVMSRGQEAIDFVQQNDPLIRHNLLDLFGSHKDVELNSRAGKEKLQAEVVERMNQLITEQGGSGELEAVYFTQFVMQ